MTDTKPPVITLDGPGGVGKGTVGQRLSEQLGWHYLDSGAIYRALAYGAMRENVSPSDTSALVRLAKKLPLRFAPDPNDVCRVFYADADVTDDVRTESCGQAASRIASNPEVRAALLERQRSFRQPPGLVADGRDMGTTVFPDANLKIFMTADPVVRAERRVKQLNAKGINAIMADVLQEIKGRDEQDATRRASPLLPAEDAIELDTTTLSIDEVVSRILDLYRQSGKS